MAGLRMRKHREGLFGKQEVPMEPHKVHTIIPEAPETPLQPLYPHALWTDRRMCEHYLPVISLVGGNNVY